MAGLSTHSRRRISSWTGRSYPIWRSRMPRGLSSWSVLPNSNSPLPGRKRDRLPRISFEELVGTCHFTCLEYSMGIKGPVRCSFHAKQRRKHPLSKCGEALGHHIVHFDKLPPLGSFQSHRVTQVLGRSENIGNNFLKTHANHEG